MIIQTIKEIKIGTVKIEFGYLCFNLILYF